MAENLTDEQLRRELIALGETGLGPITGSTRSIYLKKLKKLQEKGKPTKASKSRTTGKKLLGFSSDESDDEQPSGRKSGRKGRTGTRNKAANKSNVSLAREEEEEEEEEQKPVFTRNRSRRSEGRGRDSVVNDSVTASPSNATSIKPNETRPKQNTTRQSGRKAASKTLKPDSTTVNSSSHKPLSFKSTYLAQRTLQAGARFHVSETDHTLDDSADMPDTFESSDSDHEFSPDNSYLSSPGPELVTRGINTSTGLDNSYVSGYDHLDSSYSSTSALRNSLYNHTPVLQQRQVGDTALRRSILTQEPEQSFSSTAGQDYRPRYQASAVETLKQMRNKGPGPSYKQNGGIGHCVSTVLVILLVVFFATLAAMYVKMKGYSLPPAGNDFWHVFMLF